MSDDSKPPMTNAEWLAAAGLKPAPAAPASPQEAPRGRLQMMLGSQVLFDSDEEVPPEERDRRIERALRELGVEPAKGNGQEYAAKTIRFID